MADKLFPPLGTQTAKVVQVWIECGKHSGRAAKKLGMATNSVNQAVARYNRWLKMREEERKAERAR